jgi:sulfur reductase FeS subunit
MTRYAMVIDLNTCTGCRACQAACALENKTPYWSGEYRTYVEDLATGEFPNVKRAFIPHACMQCDHPACVEACPTGASHKNADGVVVVDPERCILCKYCESACPYGGRYEYSEADRTKALEVFGEAPPNVYIDKCNFCEQRLQIGLEPACVTTCLAGARIFGDLDDPNSQVAKLVASGKAQPMAPEAGTNPKVFYMADEANLLGMLPVNVNADGLVHIREGERTLGSLVMGLVSLGALGVFGYAHSNAKQHLSEISAEGEETHDEEVTP